MARCSWQVVETVKVGMIRSDLLVAFITECGISTTNAHVRGHDSIVATPLGVSR
jgi:hypothetical protein